MEKSFGLLFYIKKPKGFGDGEAPVYMRITANGAPVEISTKRKCDPQRWNVGAGRMMGRNEHAILFNAYLDTLQQKVFEAKRRLLEIDKDVNGENIKDILLGRYQDQEKHMLMEEFQRHNDQMKVLVGQEFSSGTLERYQTSFRHTRSFLLTRYQISDIDIRKLDYEFITEYEFWLRSARKCDHNSTIKYLSNFRKIVNRCIRYGWLQKDPFAGFKMTKREVEREALTDHELKEIAGKKFSIERLGLVRDIFVFSCYTGLAYADVKKLKRSEIVIGVDGCKWLICKREKTDATSKIPLMPIALEMMERYKDQTQCKIDARVLPVLSNQKMNSYLKEIADACGITKQLTYHIARHTFATTVTLSNGVPMETVSKMLGHRNMKTTQHYAKILDKKISYDMNALREKLKRSEFQRQSPHELPAER